MPFANREIRSASWSQRFFEGERFDRVRFASSDLSRCAFRDCSFIATVFEACDLSKTLFEGCRIEGLAFRECDLGRSAWAFCAARELEWTESSLAHARVRECLLPDLAVRACGLHRTLFEDAMLEGARMAGVLGPGARFLRSNLLGAVLKGCRFRRGEFAGGLWDLSRMDDCDLHRASFSEVRAAGVRWERLLLEEASFHDTTLAGTVEATDVNPAGPGLVYIPDGLRNGDPPPGR